MALQTPDERPSGGGGGGSDALKFLCVEADSDMAKRLAYWCQETIGVSHPFRQTIELRLFYFRVTNDDAKTKIIAAFCGPRQRAFGSRPWAATMLTSGPPRLSATPSP
jgi:hypothetical protein